MKHPGITIFLIFFGLSLIEALWGGHWGRALFWISLGLIFYLLERVAETRGAKSGR